MKNIYLIYRREDLWIHAWIAHDVCINEPKNGITGPVISETYLKRQTIVRKLAVGTKIRTSMLPTLEFCAAHRQFRGGRKYTWWHASFVRSLRVDSRVCFSACFYGTRCITLCWQIFDRAGRKKSWRSWLFGFTIVLIHDRPVLFFTECESRSSCWYLDAKRHCKIGRRNNQLGKGNYEGVL